MVELFKEVFLFFFWNSFAFVIPRKGSKQYFCCLSWLCNVSEFIS